MNLDRNSLNRLLSLNDLQLKAVMEKLARDSGLDLSEFNISPADIGSVRTALSGASDSDIEKIAEQLKGKKKER